MIRRMTEMSATLAELMLAEVEGKHFRRLLMRNACGLPKQTTLMFLLFCFLPLVALQLSQSGEAGRGIVTQYFPWLNMPEVTTLHKFGGQLPCIATALWWTMDRIDD